MSRQLRGLEVPYRIDFECHWNDFNDNEEMLAVDVWLDGSVEADIQRLTAFFNESISDAVLRSELEAIHQVLMKEELTDEWLESTYLSCWLRDRRFQLIAVMEQMIRFDHEENKPVIRCYLLLKAF